MHALGHCLPDQKSVLLQIRSEITYYSSESTKLVLWDEGADCCRWPGLSCNGAGYITSLDLSDDESITGGFNVSLLYKLPSLSVIRLDRIKFSAPFPDSFTDFTNLTVLSLADCNFSGTVPQKVFQVPTLQTIDLSSNYWDSLPTSGTVLGGSLPDFPENGSLKSLTLGWTMFSGNLPESIGNLRLLSNIHLTGCHFSGPIPVSIIKLRKLVELSLSGNSFSGPIPASLFFLPSLQTLSLDENKFSGHINELRNVTSPLEYLNLSTNNLEGTIPLFFFHLQNLTFLNLQSNKFFGQMIDLQNVTSPLGLLDLSYNNLEGAIPLFFFQLQNLIYLDLQSNKFFGQMIDCKIGHLPIDLFLALKAILVESNELNSKADYLHFRSSRGVSIYYQDSVILSLKGQTYTIEKVLSIFTSIDFSSNQFEGNIPECVGELKQLYLLNISHNALTGNIPPSLQNLKALEALDLSFNNLTGNIPVQLEILTFLEVLNLSYNHLVGRIPRSTQLDTFDASSFMGNKGLCGFQINVSCSGIDEPASPIPESEEKESTHHVDIYISVAFGFVAGLGGIFVPLLLSSKWRSYYNKMIDGILSKIFFQRGLSCNDASTGFNVSLLLKLPSLSDGNKLSGHINELQNVTSPLALLDLSNNNLEGTIPSFFFQFQNLSTLFLGMNKFSGQIPSFFFQLQNLTFLYLSSNKFSGQVIDLQNVTSPLEVVDLSSNNLEGTILSFFFQLQNLKTLHL
nr:receptor-like protein 12 [Ipomoea batatas]